MKQEKRRTYTQRNNLVTRRPKQVEIANKVCGTQLWNCSDQK